MRPATRALLAVAVTLAAAAGAVLLWPLHANGVSGNALWPRYHDFGWTSFAPLPAHPSLDELRRAGVALPQDAVAGRRHVAWILVAAAATATGLTLISCLRRRPGSTEPAEPA